MIDSAILNHAARVLGAVSAEAPADLVLRRYLMDARRLDGAGKRAVSQTVFNYFRWRGWVKDAGSWQRAVEEAWSLRERMLRTPPQIKDEALAARAVPEWVAGEVTLPVETLRQWQHDPALWLRCRNGRTAALAEELGQCVPAANLPWADLGLENTALRYEGNADLFLSRGFHEGEFEIQDLASQAVGFACAPKPGQTWWDACAGEGGKTMHLSDLMANKGLIWASDRSERRRANLKRRAARAEVFNFRSAPWEGTEKLPTKTKFDGVLVDAPCSGLGTWQRNPHARWTTTPRDVAELAAVQAGMLRHVAQSLKPNGRLVYAVCTLTRSETSAVADAFTAEHPEFEPAPVFPGSGPQETLWPHRLQANGMFIAAWRRK